MAIYEFSNLEDLKNEINEDLERFSISANRFPIRFIFLNSHEELYEIVDLLIGNSEKIELSSFLFDEDSWLNVDQVMREINELTGSSIIVPFSEYIRFLDDDQFSRILNALSELESRDLRLYIPLVGLWERFDELFWKDFHRQNNWAPIWKLNTQSKQIKIYQVNFDFNPKIKTNELKLISTTKEWFELWKTDTLESIISVNRSLSKYFHNSLPDKTFNQEIINTPNEYLSKIFGMDISIPYHVDEKEYWDKLLIDVSNKNEKNISINDIFIEKFNIKDIAGLKIEDYLNYFLDNINNRYNQWIIKNVCCESQRYKDSYLAYCFKAMNKIGNNNLARKIFLEIFELKDAEDYLDERRLLLNSLNKFDLSFSVNNFEEEFDKINSLNPSQQLMYLTTNTSIEKMKIIDIIQKNGIDNLISDLKIIFPELYYYLDWNLTLSDEIQPWILDYFREYNKSKVLNFKSEKLDELLSEKNHPDKFYTWYFNVHNNFNLTKDEDNYIIWVDALGAEWLPLFTYYLNYYGKNNSKKIKFKTLSSVNLPSATEFNKIESDEKISNLDEYIHKNHYSYPKSLLDEMDYIKEIARKIVKIDSPKISIVSDHGFSFLCTKQFGCFKKYEFKSSKHDGRYVSWEDSDEIINEDYISTKSGSFAHDNEKYIVTLKHVSLYNTPSREVHGGATPEEILVPYIVLENDYSFVEYEFYSLKDKINVSKEVYLPIKITPQPLNLPIAIYNNETLPIYKKDTKYIIQLNENIQRGKQKILIKIDDEEVGELEVTINKGGMEEEDYGGLFG